MSRTHINVESRSIRRRAPRVDISGPHVFSAVACYPLLSELSVGQPTMTASLGQQLLTKYVDRRNAAEHRRNVYVSRKVTGLLCRALMTILTIYWVNCHRPTDDDDVSWGNWRNVLDHEAFLCRRNVDSRLDRSRFFAANSRNVKFRWRRPGFIGCRCNRHDK